MALPPPLLLVPTHREAALLQEGLRRAGAPTLEIVSCGFGLAAAGALAGHALAQKRPARAILAGIAGTYRPEVLPVGHAARFDRILLHGIGVDARTGFFGPRELGFPLLDDDAAPVWDAIDLEGDGAPALLSCAAASSDEDEARRRLEHWPEALAEDMEAFAVALAARVARVPLRVIRGISNLVGDRDVPRWELEPALNAAAELIVESLESWPAEEANS